MKSRFLSRLNFTLASRNLLPALSLNSSSMLDACSQLLDALSRNSTPRRIIRPTARKQQLPWTFMRCLTAARKPASMLLCPVPLCQIPRAKSLQ